MLNFYVSVFVIYCCKALIELNWWEKW